MVRKMFININLKVYKAINAGDGAEKREPSYTVVAMQTGTATMENSVEIP